jgi:mRNA interferase RelE/StbE
MAYKLLYTKRARKDIRKLNPIVKKKLAKALEDLKENPRSRSRKLTSRKLGEYRYRIGAHRIIFDIDRKKIIILRVGDRKDIYR